MISASLQSKIPAHVTTFCVGSLPYRSVDEAVSFVREHPAVLPFWPELPQKDPAELMVPRSDRALLSAWHGYSAHEAAGLFGLIKSLEQEGRVLPLLKGQILGPLSHAFFSEELSGDFAGKVRAATAACMRQIEWQVTSLSKYCGSLLVVLDEPGFVYWEKLSDSDKALVKEQLTYLYVGAGEINCYLGLHSCAPLPQEFFSLPADLFSFDALIHSGADLFAELKNFAAVFAPGVVPAAASVDHDTEISLGVGRLAELKQKLPPAARVLFAAGCGHALADPAWVASLYSRAI